MGRFPKGTDTTVNEGRLDFNSSVTYRKQDEKIYQTASVCRLEADKNSGRKTERKLYVNRCQIGYRLPDNIKIE